jgi:Pentapeptide repeats (8 copies)
VANPEHLAKLNGGVEAWNQWRNENPDVAPDLGGANLNGANLREANLRGADLSGANLSEANLRRADLSGANLRRAFLSGAFLNWADLSGANLTAAFLGEANLSRAILSSSNLSGANLSRADLIETNLKGANLTSCSVYGISVWNVRLEGAIQSNLVITPFGERTIQIDNLEVAQFVYLLLNNDKIRHVIDTITSKVVLILGRFTPERKVVLDAIREELRKRDYLPILFDFEKPSSKDLTGTVSTLANLARFIIADLTEPSSVPHELATVVPSTVVPVQTILLEGQREYAMFPDLMRRHRWVLEPFQYTSKELLIANLNEGVIAPAEAKAKELTRK